MTPHLNDNQKQMDFLFLWKEQQRGFFFYLSVLDKDPTKSSCIYVYKVKLKNETKKKRNTKKYVLSLCQCNLFQMVSTK